VIALVVAAAAAMSGPRAHAFTEECAELQKADPGLTCARIDRSVTDGHAVEIWETTVHTDDGEGEEAFDTLAFYVAMRDDDGWYVSVSIAGFRTAEENGHHNVGEERSLQRVDTRALRVDGTPAVHVQILEAWSSFCTPCDADRQHQHGITLEQTTCVVEPAVRQCESREPVQATISVAPDVVMGRPQATAFASTCHALQADTPALECKRVQALDAGHPVEVWQTTPPIDADPSDPGDTPPTTTDVFVAIETNAGWYVSAPVFSVTDDPENAQPGAPPASDRLEATAIRKDGKRAARIELVHTEPGRTKLVLTATCVADDALIPHCETTVAGE
jgi:hypothetical protein